MEPFHPRVLKPRSGHRSGLGLVELLVALTLLTMVTLMGWLMLASIRNTATELLEEPPDTLKRALSVFESDLFHLIRSLDTEDDPDFQLDATGQTKWHRTSPGEDGRPFPLEVTYLPPDRDGNWLRTTRLPGQTRVSTNLLHSAVQSLTLSAYPEEESENGSENGSWTSKWPPEDSATAGLPGLIRLQVETTDGESERRVFLVPASLHHDPDESNDD